MIGEGGLRVAWLQAVLCGWNLLIERHVLRRAILKDDLELINTTEANGGKLAHPLLGIEQLGRTGDPVDAAAFGQLARPIGLHHQIVPFGMKPVAKRCRELQGRLAARQHHVSTGEPGHSANYLFFAHLLPRFKIGVAEPATQVAARKTHEDGRRSRVMAFALQ